MFQSDNNSKLSTDKVTKAMRHEGMKPGISWTNDQARKVSDWAKQTRSKNGTINTQSTEEFGSFIK
ncbi:MAG: hypothetical protein AAB492_03065 [Patescibacteria group bacterium]